MACYQIVVVLLGVFVHTFPHPFHGHNRQFLYEQGGNSSTHAKVVPKTTTTQPKPPLSLNIAAKGVIVEAEIHSEPQKPTTSKKEVKVIRLTLNRGSVKEK